MSTEQEQSELPQPLRDLLRSRPPLPQFPEFRREWLQSAVVPAAGGMGHAWGLPVRRRYLLAAAGVLAAFVLGAVFGNLVLTPSGSGYSEVVRLRNGVRLRGKVVNVVGAQVVVETPDSVFVIDAEQVKSVNYVRPRHKSELSRGSGREVIELANGMVLRGRIVNQVGSEFLVESNGENFAVDRADVRKIRYLAEAPATK